MPNLNINRVTGQQIFENRKRNFNSMVLNLGCNGWSWLICRYRRYSKVTLIKQNNQPAIQNKFSGVDWFQSFWRKMQSYCNREYYSEIFHKFGRVTIRFEKTHKMTLRRILILSWWCYMTLIILSLYCLCGIRYL